MIFFQIMIFYSYFKFYKYCSLTTYTLQLFQYENQKSWQHYHSREIIIKDDRPLYIYQKTLFSMFSSK